MAGPNEDDLLAELDKLEKSTVVRKGGDALQDAPHDGGFATEGTNIQKQAKKMYKALVKSGYKKSVAKALALKAFSDADSDSDSDSGSDEASSPMEKAMGGDSMSSDDDSGDSESEDGESSDDDSSSEDESSDDASSPIGKSTGAAALANASKTRQPSDSLRKAIVEEHPDAQGAFDAVPILGQLIDSIDRVTKHGGGLSKKDLGSIKKSISQVENNQRQFNGKLAKALSMIAGRVIETEAIVKKMASEPINTANRRPTLNKSDIQHPSFHHGETQQIVGGEGGYEASPLSSVPYYDIQKALTELCMVNKAELMDVTKFENSKGDLRLLPPNVIKQLEDRLCPAS